MFAAGLPSFGRPEFTGSTGVNALDHMKIQLMVRAYQVRGHRLAKLDPLDISNLVKNSPPELDPKSYGFEEADMDNKITVGSQAMLPGLKDAVTGQPKEMTIRDIISSLKQIYCKTKFLWVLSR